MEKETALKILRDRHANALFSERTALETLIPELAESEDESIKKDIIIVLEREATRCFKETGSMPQWYDRSIAWLEKQGEKKPVDKAELQFKPGDWVKNNESKEAFFIKSIGNAYCMEDIAGVAADYPADIVHKLSTLWAIDDAKDGDVLLFEGNYNSIVLFQGIGINGKGRINYHCKCDLENYSFGVQGDVACLGTIEKDAEHYHPATKEQRDILFQKMKVAGYEWDAEKKELKKIEQ